MMRVTTFGVNAQYLGDLNDIMSKYQTLEQQLSTGRKLNQPADDPVAFESDIQAQTSIDQVAQWTSNAKQASTQMQMTDAAMGSLQGGLGNIRTAILQALNGTYTQNDFGNTLASIQQQVSQVSQTANTNDGQQFIFSGANGKSIAIDDSTGVLVWKAGTTPDQMASIGQNVSVRRDVNGQQLFNLTPSTNPAAPSLIDTLNNIVQHMKQASQAPDEATMQTYVQQLQIDMSNLDDNIDNVSAMRADLGGRMDRVNAVQTQLSQTTNLLAQQKGQVEDADLAQVMTQLTTQQTVYQAALMSGQKLILPTLADVLKG